MNQVAIQDATIEHLDRKIEAMTKEGINEHIKALINEQFGVPTVRRCKNANSRMDDIQKELGMLKETLKVMRLQVAEMSKAINDRFSSIAGAQTGVKVGDAQSSAAANKKRKADADGSYTPVNTDIEQFQRELKQVSILPWKHSPKL